MIKYMLEYNLLPSNDTLAKLETMNKKRILKLVVNKIQHNLELESLPKFPLITGELL